MFGGNLVSLLYGDVSVMDRGKQRNLQFLKANEKEQYKLNKIVVLWDELLEDDKIISAQITNFMAVKKSDNFR